MIIEVISYPHTPSMERVFKERTTALTKSSAKPYKTEEIAGSLIINTIEKVNSRKSFSRILLKSSILMTACLVVRSKEYLQKGWPFINTLTISMMNKVGSKMKHTDGGKLKKQFHKMSHQVEACRFRV